MSTNIALIAYDAMPLSQIGASIIENNLLNFIQLHFPPSLRGCLFPALDCRNKLVELELER